MDWGLLTESLKRADDALSLAYLRLREARIKQTPESEKLFLALWNARNELADAVHAAYLVRKLHDQAKTEEAPHVA